MSGRALRGVIMENQKTIDDYTEGWPVKQTVITV